ncbi:hypothetical protein Pcinc_000609 [Petrolisthes cinctipes]|uniref:Uncharacterized protein n=1 Tax=Petrolisthes cinctipes TaxID=88211 RepID=A0AAE1L490_PETCI|nr:hypothetical protein Pcinc_000609 [Petrolisthes cinctipes]
MHWCLSEDAPPFVQDGSSLIELDTEHSFLQDSVWNRRIFKKNDLFLAVKVPSKADFDLSASAKASKDLLLINICDPVVFFAAASVNVDRSDANRFDIFNCVITDGRIAEDNISLPVNFVTNCGFTLDGLV